MPTFNVSYKPQKISPKFEGTVRQLLHKKIRDSYLHPQVGVLTAWALPEPV
jgi:ATP-binding cassette subfamily E protein 1